MTATNAFDWRAIEQAARDQVAAELDAAEATPLVFGDPIAWATQMYGRTDELSAVHHVGVPVNGHPYTTCGEAIPAPVMWLTLSPAFIRSLGPCRFCASEYARAIQEDAA